ncbi:serine/threonine-protein kinase [Cellulomonas sp.]|uniref:serine/threonine-protein kinase n=1 Tax=Cellulomonas sp. TaxID=40001 RepID=UPI001B1767AF|nr:serine/threonine-protein kinase [Cellulomonas sp.]MBO9553018.1 serine/threonine protein kinase [Cellulomonas sp.]
MERIGLAPGAEIGGYTIVAPLGSGGMGAVYRAVDGGGTPVALKLLHPHVGTDAAVRDRLRREVHALQKLRHPAVAAILDAEADSTEAFIVTELIAGDTLEEHVRERGTLDAAGLLELAEGLRAALAAVHAAGVVHRDLKPSNVLVTDDGPVLIDFGIAQAADDTKVTSTGLVIGTPGYIAPELLEGQDPSPETDFWGWAAVLVFAATGRAPFGTRPLEAVLARARAGEVDVAGLGPLTAAALRGAVPGDPAGRTAPDDVVAALTVVAAEGDLAPDEVATTELDASTATGRGDVDASALAGATGGAATATVVAPVVGAGPTAGGGTATLVAQDGLTRTFDPTVDPVPAGPGAPPDGEWADDELAYDDDYDPEGVDWIQDDLDASEVPEPEGSGYVRPPARRRWGTLLALALVVLLAGSLYPGITLVVVGVLVVLVRTAGSAVESMHARRERAGVRRSDHAVTVAATPWHLLRSVVGLLPSVLVATSVVVIVVGVLWWLIDSGTWVLEGAPSGSEPEGLTASLVVGGLVLLGVLLVWWGPLSSMTRTGARRVLAVVAPGRRGALIAVVLLLVAAVILFAVLRDGAAIVWAPLPTPTLP